MGGNAGLDWGQIGSLSVFCAVLAWSRVRFVCFADNQRAATTLAALAACFEALGGVLKTELSDRMGCLKGGTVAGVVVPTADYVRCGQPLFLPAGLWHEFGSISQSPLATRRTTDSDCCVRPRKRSRRPLDHRR